MTADLAWSPSLAHPGSMHRQSTWKERALDPNIPLPAWLRVAYLGLARHKANGHAIFGDGELLGLLQKAKPKTCERQLRRAISDAVKYGYLNDRSSARCLIVPPESVSNGIGHWNERCRYCG